MFFLMRSKILPQWENKDNIDGGYISYKIDNGKLQEAWKEIMMAFVGGYIVRQPDYLSMINGVSISPKKFYGIIKIWIKDDSSYNRDFCMPDKLMTDDIPYIDNADAIYQKNSEKS